MRGRQMRYVVVIGSGSRIGRALVKQLAENGAYEVYALSCDPPSPTRHR